MRPTAARLVSPSLRFLGVTFRDAGADVASGAVGNSSARVGFRSSARGLGMPGRRGGVFNGSGRSKVVAAQSNHASDPAQVRPGGMDSTHARTVLTYSASRVA